MARPQKHGAGRRSSDFEVLAESYAQKSGLPHEAQGAKLEAGEPILCECCLRPLESPADAAEKHRALVHARACESQCGSANDDLDEADYRVEPHRRTPL